MKDVLSCGHCGSRRLSGNPEEGFLCLDCGLHARGDFETEESFGNAPDHRDGFWSSYDSRFDGEGGGSEEAEKQRSPEAPDPDPGFPASGLPRSLLSDPHSPLRCACCFELAGRCRRLGAGAGLRCCVGCRCAEERS